MKKTPIIVIITLYALVSLAASESKVQTKAQQKKASSDKHAVISVDAAQGNKARVTPATSSVTQHSSSTMNADETKVDHAMEFDTP